MMCSWFGGLDFLGALHSSCTFGHVTHSIKLPQRSLEQRTLVKIVHTFDSSAHLVSAVVLPKDARSPDSWDRPTSVSEACASCLPQHPRVRGERVAHLTV